MSHTIFICTIQNKDHCNLIAAAIVNMGVNVSVAADKGTLYAVDEGKKTTIMALTVNNFNTKLSNADLLGRICDAINDYDYFGIILKNPNGGSNWRAGNVSFKGFEKAISKADKYQEEVKPEKDNKKQKDQPKVEDPKPPESEPQPKPEPEDVKRIDLKLLTTIVKCSCSMSDTFFDGTTQADRKLLLRELEALCEDTNANIEDIVK